MHSRSRLAARLCAAAAAAALLASCGGGGDEDLAAGEQELSAAPQQELPADADDLMAASVAARPAQHTRYIVKFRDDVDNPGSHGRDIAASHGGRVQHVYEHAIKGFSVSLPAAAVDRFVQAMEHRGDVEIVEPDAIARTVQTVQPGATWGLDRTDQRSLPLSGTYAYERTGAGVNAYIIDTGLRRRHQEFAGRVRAGYTAINDGRGTSDCDGHGTHVAGTVGGTTWGMAKGVSLTPVRVLACDGTGYVSGIVAGIDWMIANAVKPAVGNMSLGGGVSASMDAAVAKAVNAGITMVVAAGNSNVDACTASPAREPSALTVGATDSGDGRAGYSNWGTCLDVFAPGSAITSASNASDTGAATMSGTSMATPHVAGLAALFLQAHPSASPATVMASIKSAATTGAVSNPGSGSPNALIHTSAAEAAPASAPAPGTPTEVSVASLAGTRWRQATGTGWRANVKVVVKNGAGSPVGGARVTGDYTAGGKGLSCTTDSSGLCAIRSGTISGYTLQTTFTVRTIAGTGLAYDSTGNAVSSVTIRKP